MTISDVKSSLAREVTNALELQDTSDVVFEFPDFQFGDLAIPCFPFAKVLRKSPSDIAQVVADSISKIPWVRSVDVVSGYVNIFLDLSVLVNDIGLLRLMAQEKEKVAVEFASPNTNKPLHLGHMRNIAIGESMSAAYRLLGFDVVKTEVVNDRGIAIAKMMVIYDRFHKGEIPEGKPDHFAGELYVEFESRVKEQPELEALAQEVLHAWEEGDKYWYGVWKMLRDWVVTGQQETYRRLGASFDERVFESDIYRQGKELVLAGLASGAVVKDVEKQYVYADLEEIGLPNKVLLRSNGTALYITQDLALLDFRLHKDSLCRGAERVIYVTDFAQNLQFEQLFAIARKLGIITTEQLVHIGYGAVRRPEGKMSSRKGNVVQADHLIQQIEEVVRTQYSRMELSADERDRRVRVISDAAYKFYLTVTSAKKDMIFDEGSAVSLEGKTGPYVLYTVARLTSLIRKFEGEPGMLEEYDFVSERELIMFSSKYHEVMRGMVAHFDPAELAQFLYELSELVNSYYHRTQVLGGDISVVAPRIAVLSKVRRVLVEGLKVLGIESLEEM